MSWFRRRATVHPQATDFVAGERSLWIENRGSFDLRVMLEPWCDLVDVPPGQYAKLTAHFTDDRDEFLAQYYPDACVSVYCPPETTLTVVEKR